MGKIATTVASSDVAKLKRLVEASRILNSTTELSELLPFIIAECATLVDAEVAAIILFDPETRKLTYSASSNQLHLRMSDMTVSMSDSLIGSIFRWDKSVIIGDVTRSREWNPQADAIDGLTTRSIIGVPMHNVSARPIGVLQAINKQQGAFCEADLETLSTLADLAGVAVARARLIEKLRQVNRQLSELDHLKSEFIAVASHELRTPLAIIMGYVQVLRESVADAETVAQLDNVLKAAVRLRTIIQDMLNLQYVDAEGSKLTLTTIDLVQTVSAVVNDRRDLADAKELNLKVHLPDQKLRVLGDRSSIEVIISNLLSNAIKFTSNGGRVAVVVEQHGKEAWVRIRDTGIGIPAEKQQRIFDRFYQVEPHLRRHYQGLGLGLSVVKDLLSIQGGRIWVHSEEGKGSEFIAMIPLMMI